jgi:death on curing protein
MALAEQLLGAGVGARDIGLLGSAVARPQTSVGGQDAYVDMWTKAAAVLHSIVNNHALVDGNKRLGWLATAVFLEINGVPASRASNGAVYELVMDVASTHVELNVIADRLFRLIDELPT